MDLLLCKFLIYIAVGGLSFLTFLIIIFNTHVVDHIEWNSNVESYIDMYVIFLSCLFAGIILLFIHKKKRFSAFLLVVNYLCLCFSYALFKERWVYGEFGKFGFFMIWVISSISVYSIKVFLVIAWKFFVTAVDNQKEQMNILLLVFGTIISIIALFK